MIGFDAPIRRDRVVQLRLRCVAAPRAAATLQVTLANQHGRSSHVRFSIPAGGHTTLTPRLTRAAYTAARRDHNDLGTALIVHGVTVDRGGWHRFRGGVSGRLR